jgi:hypothetical protein
MLNSLTQNEEKNLDQLTILFHTLGGYVWGPVLLVLLVGTGLYLTIRLGALQIRLLPIALHMAFSKGKNPNLPGDISQFQSLMTADVGQRLLWYGHQICRRTFGREIPNKRS